MKKTLVVCSAVLMSQICMAEDTKVEAKKDISVGGFVETMFYETDSLTTTTATDGTSTTAKAKQADFRIGKLQSHLSANTSTGVATTSAKVIANLHLIGQQGIGSTDTYDENGNVGGTQTDLFEEASFTHSMHGVSLKVGLTETYANHYGDMSTISLIQFLGFDYNKPKFEVNYATDDLFVGLQVWKNLGHISGNPDTEEKAFIDSYAVKAQYSHDMLEAGLIYLSRKTYLTSVNIPTTDVTKQFQTVANRGSQAYVKVSPSKTFDVWVKSTMLPKASTQKGGSNYSIGLDSTINDHIAAHLAVESRQSVINKADENPADVNAPKVRNGIAVDLRAEYNCDEHFGYFAEVQQQGKYAYDGMNTVAVNTFALGITGSID